MAAAMVAGSNSESFRVVDLAERANVGVPTIYYHFESRVQVIAEAQMANYFATTEPMHKILSRAETALAMGDEVDFWEAVRLNIERAWSSGQRDEKMGIVRLLLDVWADAKSRARFRELLDIQFARWVALVDDAKALGWMHESLDAQTVVAVFWSASVGQVITSGSAYIDVAPETVADFYLKLAREWSRGPTSD
ncbi:MAG: TetR/AcrR family transcriptional regulator [Acidimicrobiales bacterium]